MPRKGDTIKIIPTHIVGPNKIFVQIIDGMEFTEFTEFQEGELQNVEIKKFEPVEGNIQVLNIRNYNKF